MTENALALDGKDGVQVALGGDTIHWANAQQGGAGEIFGILVAAGVLFLTLGVVAMWLPLVNALFAMVVSLALMAIIGTRIIDVTDWTPQLAAMIGIGVGIDYALLILNRFRLERASGRDVREATLTALDTSGRAVLFAGIVVVIAMLGMVLLGLSFLYGPAIGAALSVLATMGAALTLMPALLSKIGGRVKPAAGDGEGAEDLADREHARRAVRRGELLALAQRRARRPHGALVGRRADDEDAVPAGGELGRRARDVAVDLGPRADRVRRDLGDPERGRHRHQRVRPGPPAGPGAAVPLIGRPPPGTARPAGRRGGRR
jgi:uncharacterized membrane protein YdfJ with MMPL/SSD domain